jgi:hypothetical protein
MYPKSWIRDTVLVHGQVRTLQRSIENHCPSDVHVRCYREREGEGREVLNPK